MDNGVFYESIGENTISISGVISFSENAGADLDLVLIVSNNGTEVSREVLDAFTSTGVMTLRRSVIAKTLVLQDRDRVALRIESSTASTDIEIVFNSETALNISSKDATDGVKDSECYGLSVYDAFASICANMGLQFQSQFFSKGDGAGDFITNGNNIRGINSEVNLNLQGLFSQLAIIYNLELSLENGVVTIEKAGNSRTVLLDKKVDNFSQTPDLDKLYSKVRAGYSTWQSESKLKGVEFNSIREYETELNYGDRTLTLVVDIITAGYIIEEQRRMQFDATRSKQGGKYDESIFLIARDGNTVQKLETYNPVANILPSGGVYNFKYSPARIVQNNAEKLNHAGKLNFVSGQGNYNVKAGGITENQGFNFGEHLPMVATFEAEINPAQFEDLDHIVFEHCGISKEIKVIDAQMSLQPNGNGFITITGELKQ